MRAWGGEVFTPTPHTPTLGGHRQLRPASCPRDPEPGEDTQSQISPSQGSGRSWSMGAKRLHVQGPGLGAPCLFMVHSELPLSLAPDEDSSVTT